MSQNPSLRSLIATLIIAAVLAGCSSQPQTIAEKTLPPMEFTQESADQLLSRAERSPFPESEKLKIQAADLLISEQMIRAQTLLDSINYDELPSPLQAELAVVRARVAEQTGKNREIFFWLDREPVINSPDTHLQDQAHIIKAKAYNRYDEYVAALDEWLTLSDISKLDNTPELRDAFWKTLLNVPEDRLIAMGSQTTSEAMKGWMELARVYRPGKSLDQQLNDLKAWRYSWQNHPANAYLPKDINALQAANVKQPEKITLMLPTSGPLASAGRAIRDGFIAAYYQSLNRDGTSTPPEITILDTHNKNIIELAAEAQNQGTELIIGPLDKTNVSALKQNPPQGITVLALNALEDENAANKTITNRFFEFGLSTEDEARTVARRGILDGHKRALILRPDSVWGQRASSSFVEEWVRLGGEIAGESQFNSQTEFSQLAGQALLVDQSQKRAKDIDRLLREKLGFEPRRRHDVDMIYIPSNPKEARQLKPALSYQFAGKLPVYATSSAYTGKVDRSRDQDLDNLRIPVMQWYLPNNKNSLKQNITSIWSSAKGQYGSLYAMGVDAFKLYPRLQQLSSLPGSRLDGLTGWLSINDKHHIERELSWQVFKNGLLSPLPIPAQDASNVLAAKPKE